MSCWDLKKAASLFLFVFAAIVALSFCLTPAANAQVTGATLSGTVTDSSGAAVPNSHVAALNIDQNETRESVTDAAGFYSVPNLVPGNYKVTVTAQGFQTYVHSGIELTIGEKQVLNFAMTVGQISQEIQVTGEAPVVELQSSAIGETVTSRTTVELPLNGRDWTSLASLQPAAANLSALQQPIGSSSVRANRGFGLQISFAGTRPAMNNYRVDGISEMDAVGGSPGSTLGVSLGVDSIGEFSVNTSNYSAEYGRTAGGIVNAVTKSGTNQIHGDAYMFMRDARWDARNYLDPTTGNVDGRGIPPYTRNQFGGSIGAPIQKDKTFVFGDYEGYRADLGQTANDTVPEPTLQNGIVNFSSAQTIATCKAMTPAGDGTTTSNPNQCQFPVNGKMVPFFALYPAPTGGITPNSFGNLGQFLLEQTTRFDENFVTARLDHKFSDKDSMFATYKFDKGLVDAPSSFNYWTYGNSDVMQFISLEETHVFSPALVNSVRGGYNRMNPYAGAGVSVQNSIVTNTSLGAFPGLNCPAGTIPGTTAFNCFNGNTIIHPVFNDFQGYDDAFWTKSTHSLKFGFAVERMQTNESIILTPNGAYSFGSIPAWLENQPTNFSGASPTGRSELGFRQTLFGGYIQDDWRVRKNLTLNLGLRYEMVTVPTEVQNRLSNLPSITATAPNLGSPLFSNPTKRNFAPRIGLAWDPFGDGKTSVRAAFGIFDILPLNYLFTWGGSRTAPFTETIAFASGPNHLLSGKFPDGGYGAATANAGLSPFQYNYIQQNPPRSFEQIWNLTIQHQITQTMAATIGYVGSRADHIINREEEFNQVPGTFTPYGLLWPTTAGTVPNPRVGQIVGDYWGGLAWYNALTAQVTKRMSHGFQIQGSYTFSKAMDTGSSSAVSDDFSNSVVNLLYYCITCRRALSEFDIKNNLVINYIWDLPNPKVGGAIGSHILGGWEAGGIFTARSGLPFTPLIGGDPLNELGAAPQSYPSYSGACQPNQLINARSALNYINLSCFTVPNSAALATAGLCKPFPSAAQLNSCSNLMGNVGRNSLIGPGQMAWDFSLFKNNYIPRISEAFNIQFRAEFFNILNRRNMGVLSASNGTLFQANGAPQANAGSTTGSASSTTSRQIQFALKLIF